MKMSFFVMTQPLIFSTTDRGNDRIDVLQCLLANNVTEFYDNLTKIAVPH